MTREQITAEHMQARAHGGSDEAHNIAAACGLCNSARGTRGAAKFRNMLRGKVSQRHPRIRERQIIFRLNQRTDQAVKRILASVTA